MRALACVAVAVVVVVGVLRIVAGCASVTEYSLADFTTVSGSTDISASVTDLVVEGRVGGVIVEAEDAEHVRVEATVRLRSHLVSETPVGAFADHVTVALDGDTVTVADAHMGDADEQNWGVALTVYVPARLSVEAATGTGDVATTDMVSAVALTSGAGDLTINSDAVQAVSCETGTGRVRCTAVITGAVSAHTGAGNVDLSIGTVGGALSVEVGTGDVSATATQAPTHTVTLNTGTGNVALHIPSNAPGAYALRTGTGNITISGHDGVSVTSNFVSANASGTFGSGSPTYTIGAGTGNITLGVPAT